jgi:hypothetical protein
MPRRAMSRETVATVDCPKKAILPSLAGLRPEMQLNMVLLPAPFGPIRAITSPALTVNERPLLATRPPKRLVTSSP